MYATGLSVSGIPTTAVAGNLLTKTLRFEASNPGQYMVCASAIDSSNVTSDLVCYTMSVLASAPTILAESRLPSSDPVNLDTITNGLVSIVASFDTPVKRSATQAVAAFVKLNDGETNTTLASLDARDGASVFLSGQLIMFSFNAALLQAFKTYYITFDEGKLILSYYLFERALNFSLG